MIPFSQDQLAWAKKRDANSVSSLTNIISCLYRYRGLRRYCLWLCQRLEGGRFFSATLRRILRMYHGVSVGRYSYGPCLVPGALPPGTVVGSYCSIAGGLSIHRRNHPPDTLTQHPFFYNKDCGLLDYDSIMQVEDNRLIIGNDVWIGDRVTVLPGCRMIANGAVIGAGSIVTKDVEPFSVVAGNPAKPIRLRYPESIATEIQRSEWWNLSLSELLDAGDLLTDPIDLKRLRCFAARACARASGSSATVSVEVER